MNQSDPEKVIILSMLPISEMDMIDDSIAPWIPDGGGNRLDPKTFKKFLELLPSKFGPVIIDNSGWPWVVAQSLAVERDCDVVTGFVVDGYKFWPPSGFVNCGKGMYCFRWCFFLGLPLNCSIHPKDRSGLCGPLPMVQVCWSWVRESSHTSSPL